MLATLSSAITAPETAAGASPTGAPSSPTPSSPPPSSTAPPPRSSDHDQRPLLPHATPPDPRRPARDGLADPSKSPLQRGEFSSSTSGEFRCALTPGGSLHCVGALDQRPPCLGRSGRGRRRPSCRRRGGVRLTTHPGSEESPATVAARPASARHWPTLVETCPQERPGVQPRTLRHGSLRARGARTRACGSRRSQARSRIVVAPSGARPFRSRVIVPGETPISRATCRNDSDSTAQAASSAAATAAMSTRPVRSRREHMGRKGNHVREILTGRRGDRPDAGRLAPAREVVVEAGRDPCS